LFVAFAPVEAPRIAVAVVIENGGHGGSVAAPIARAVMDSYLLDQRVPESMDAAVRGLGQASTGAADDSR
jgi:cell division protein FtsI/penicillin-binding protein 2